MRYEVRLFNAYFYVTAPDEAAAECEAAYHMDNAGIIGEIDDIILDESDNDDDN